MAAMAMPAIAPAASFRDLGTGPGVSPLQIVELRGQMVRMFGFTDDSGYTAWYSVICPRS